MEDDDFAISEFGIRAVYEGNHKKWASFGITQPDRFRHCLVIGQTGTGKSSLLKNLFLQDVYAGRGAAFLDPHGGDARLLLDHIPPHRMRDVVYLDPAAHDHVPALNLLQSVPPRHRDRVAQEIVGTFRYIWADVWGTGRMQYILLNTVSALLDFPEDPGATLLGVNRMYTDSDYRARVVRHIKNPSVRAFWLHEYENYTKSLEVEATSPIQNKIGQLTLPRTLQNIVGQVHPTLDLPFIMDNRRILIANLDKGRLGATSSSFLGALLLTGIYLSAMRRSSIPEHERQPFHLYLDEFHSFATSALVPILSESRKQKLSLTAACQFLDQLQSDVRSAVFGNVGTLIAFRVGSEDAPHLAEHLDDTLPQQLTELPIGEVCARLLSAGIPETFFASTIPPDFTRFGKGERLIDYSRLRYTRPRAMVEDKIARWYGTRLPAGCL